MDQVRAKFQCQSEKRFPAMYGGNKQFEFHAVYGTAGENGDYSAATPQGRIELTVTPNTGAAASGFFEPGESYYVTFTKVPKVGA